MVILSSLSEQVKQFIFDQTKSASLADLAAELQLSLELGSTAMVADKAEPIEPNSYIMSVNGRCGFTRYHDYEKFLWTSFSNHKEKSIEQPMLLELLKKATNILSEESFIAEQWIAALSSLIFPRMLISGAPGTGKTTTVVKLILLHLITAENLTIALCAPTGKAAHRMLSGLQASASQLAHMDELMQQSLPQKSYTVHRLLGFDPKRNTFAYNENRQLPYDLIVLDESSMLDTELAYHLFLAIPKKCHVVLLGDAMQLPAVGSGFVFGDLCARLGTTEKKSPSDLHEKTSSRYNLMTTGLTVEDLTIEHLRPAIELSTSFRFSQASGIAAMAHALQQGQFKFGGLEYEDLSIEILPNTEAQLNQLKHIFSTNKNASIMLLTPKNQGPLGVVELNRLVQMVRFGNTSNDPMHFLAKEQPILITQNDYGLDIYNGDTAIMRWRDEQWWADFDHLDSIPLKSINHWQNANAITIHKSQGSEYDVVVLAVPADATHEMLSRELLYTAVTRAKKQLFIWTEPSALESAVRRSEQRSTFLQIL